MLTSLGADYVRTARAKGVSERNVVGKHALRNSLITVTTVIGLEFGVLISGAVVTEKIFGIAGFGRLSVDAIARATTRSSRASSSSSRSATSSSICWSTSRTRCSTPASASPGAGHELRRGALPSPRARRRRIAAEAISPPAGRGPGLVGRRQFVLAAVFAPLGGARTRRTPPTSTRILATRRGEHLLGTDEFGRDTSRG